MVEKINNFDDINNNNNENSNEESSPLDETIARLKEQISKTNGRSKVGKNAPKSGAGSDFRSTSEAPKITEAEAQQIFESESTQEPPMPVDLPLPTADLERNDIDGVKGLEESISSGSDLTDMQWTGEKLFPSKWGGKYTKNNRMIGRLDPAVFLPVIHLNAVDRIMRSDPKLMIDVNEIYMEEYTIASIELDGFGRGEALELAGAAREEKRMDRQFGGLAPGMG